MRYAALGQSGGGAAVSTEPRAATGVAPSVGVKEIPYDYVATFKLTGTRGARVQDVITISTEGTFVAVSVGYSFVPAAEATARPPVPSPFDTTFNAFFPVAGDQIKAFRTVFESLLLRFAGIHFLYSIVDSATGRELQNKAVHNIAALGSADGDRPFRPFARPVLFVPRSTIRIEVEEVSEGPFFKDGTLFLVLHGYKRLGE
jgi:hypothetical protein